MLRFEPGTEELKFPPFMDPEGSLTAACHESDESSANLHTLRSILILYDYVSRVFILFRISRLNFCVHFLMSSLRATCPTHLVPLDLFTRSFKSTNYEALIMQFSPLSLVHLSAPCDQTLSG